MSRMKRKKGVNRINAGIEYEQIQDDARRGYPRPSITCFHAQQYVEMLLKDKLEELDYKGETHIHDLINLIENICQIAGVEMPISIEMSASFLNDCYIESRYSSRRTAMTAETAEFACGCAEEIVSFVESLFTSDSMVVSKSRKPKGSTNRFRLFIRR